MRNKGKVELVRNPNGVELYAVKSIIDKVHSVVLKSENTFQFGINRDYSGSIYRAAKF